MECIARAVLLIILLFLSLSSVQNTAPCEDSAHNISTYSEESQLHDNVLIKAIAILDAFVSDMDKPQSKDLPTRVLNLIDDLISEVSRIDVVNALQHFRCLALQHIMTVQKELIDIAQNIDSASKFDNSHVNNATTNQWTTILKRNQHLTNANRLFSIVCHVIGCLIKMTAKDLRNCCNITMNSNISLCRTFKSLVITGSDYMAEMGRVLDEVQFCLDNTDASAEYKTRCHNLVFNEISNLSDGLDQLIRKLKKLLGIRFLYSKWCILFVNVDVKEQNKNVL